MKTLLTQAILKQELHYDPDTGQFTRLNESKRKRHGEVAGCLTQRGYIRIRVAGTRHQAHCLAFLWMNGEWPKEEVDHENGCKADNKWTNLREATHQQNTMNTKLRINNTSGFKGVSWYKRSKKWVARIGTESKHIGYFANKEDAITAYNQAAQNLFGPFRRIFPAESDRELLATIN